MNIQLHKNARTPPAIRLELQSQPESVSDRELAEAYHLNRHTVAKWRQRKQGGGRCLAPPPSGLPLDDLLAVTREFSSTPRSRALAWPAVCAATACLTSRR